MHREPVDSTFYEPNVIVAPQHETLRPDGPEKYGVKLDDLSCETRGGRNVVKTWAVLKTCPHPLIKDGYKFFFHTLKYRHGTHTMPIDTDMIAVLSAQTGSQVAFAVWEGGQAEVGAPKMRTGWIALAMFRKP